MAATAEVVGQNPFEKKARLDSIARWKYIDKLDELSEFSFTVQNDVYHKANAIIERNAFVPFLKPFRGFITDFAVDETEISLKAQEFAFHLTRGIFVNDGEKRVTYTDEDWFDPLWKHRTPIILDKKLVPDQVKGFPLLINLGANTPFKNNALSNGDDFLITEKDGITKIPHEIENYDSATGTLVLWVKVPKVSDSARIEMFIYYDNPAAGNQEDIINVWKDLYIVDGITSITTFAYDMVQHLDANSVDSTENNNDGTDTSISYAVADIIGNASNFDAVDSKIDASSGSTIDDIFDSNGWITSWFNANSDGEGSLGVIWQKGNTLLRVRDESGGNVRLELVVDFNTTDGIWQTAVDIPINTNTRIDVEYDNSTVGNNPILTVNGVARTVGNGLTETQTPVGTRVSDAASNFIIGNNTGQTATFDGEIDEVRTMKVPPADISDIIKAEYNNQNTPTTFVTTLTHHEYKKAANLIAQDILDSANIDQPSGVTWTLSTEFPTDIITVGFNLRNNYQALDEIAIILGKDLFFDNKNYVVFIETKGHTFSKDEIMDIIITSKPEKATKNFANTINILGKKTDIGSQLESVVTTSTVLRNNYEVVIADSQIATTDQASKIAAIILTEMQKLTPAIKGRIPLTQFLRFNLQSGDIIMISQPEKELNGFFRVMEVAVTKLGVKIALESTETGIIRHRSRSLTDTISAILSKLTDSAIESA